MVAMIKHKNLCSVNAPCFDQVVGADRVALLMPIPEGVERLLDLSHADVSNHQLDLTHVRVVL